MTKISYILTNNIISNSADSNKTAKKSAVQSQKDTSALVGTFDF